MGQGQTILVDSVRKLLRRGAQRNLVKILQRRHAADIALVFRQLSDREEVTLFGLIPELDQKGEVLTELDPFQQDVILAELSDDELVEVLDHVSADDAADLLDRLDEERAERILASWQSKEASEVDTLLGYDPDSAGGIMSPDVFALPENTTVREAIETLQASHEELEMAFYLYVVNEHGHLVGVCSLRQLVVCDPDTILNSIMAPDIISVRTGTDQEEVARLVARYNFLAIPVVDQSNRLVGVVTVDDIIDVIREEATEDMMRMAGAGPVDVTEHTSPLKNARLRMPWLLASFFGGLGSLLVIHSFESTMERVAILAGFIPIVLGMGGNVGTQAATVVTRGLALGRVDVGQFLTVVGREVSTGILLGVTYGVALAAVASLLYGGNGDTWDTWQLAVAVCLAIVCSMTLAASVGGGFPLLFARIGVDPAIAAGPVVTTSVDLLGIAAFLLIARAFLV